ncbi:unnamed protein product [Soboliphyme baturini]|uniref:Receptor expression-enhancing protein n=1 Tax=Soboliphyme baturini TaxID=241478 RepID=A0A3P8C1K7_9BILA|nr:unnamed protein product [Soboliphyme baturini]
MLEAVIQLPFSDKHVIGRVVANIAWKTQTSRENIAYIGLGMFGVYMVTGYFAGLICNLIGFVYPAIVSIKSVESGERRNDAKWLIYWTVFGLCSMPDLFSQTILTWFPIYWLCKCVFFLWLYLPSTNGTEAFYNKIISPFSKTYLSLLDTIVR